MQMIKRTFAGSKVKSDEDKRSVASAPSGNPVKQFSLPRLQTGLSDVVSSHRAGQQFEHAVIATSTQESKESILQRLRKTVNRPKKTDIMFSKIPITSLSDTHHEISLEKLESKKFDDYVRIKEIQVNFTPLTSVYDRFTSAIFELHDLRHVASTLRRSHTINSNISDSFRFELDYCVPKGRLDCFTIVINCESTGLLSGDIWGVLQMTVLLETAKTPYQTDMNSTMAVMQLPGTFLNNDQVDPRFLDLTMDGDTRKEMILMRQRGDIVSTDKPQLSSASPIKYAGTSYGLVTNSNTNENPHTISPNTAAWITNQESVEGKDEPLPSTFTNMKNPDGPVLKSKIKKSVAFDMPIIPENSIPVANSSLTKSESNQEDINLMRSPPMSNRDSSSTVNPSSVPNPFVYFEPQNDNTGRYEDLSSVGSETPSAIIESISPTGVPAQDNISHSSI